MKKLLIIAALSLPLFFSVPKTQAQVHVNVNIGNPLIRPYPDAVWVPGYYYYDPVRVRRVWVAGNWHHDNGRHLGWYKDHGEGRGHGRGRGHD